MSPSTRPSTSLILFVDDELQALKYFKRAYVNDFEMLTAESADEAESLLQQRGNEIAVVMSDQRMPGRTGASLLAAVRDQHPHIVRILTTAYSDLENAIEAVNKGEVFRYIVKPWDIDLLRQDLRIALQVYHLQHERSLLLAEKVSVRQRLRAADRARTLLVAASGLRDQPNAHHAICNYVKQVAAMAPPSSEPQDINLDLWTEAETETTLLKAVVEQLSVLPHLHHERDEQHTTLQEARQIALNDDKVRQLIDLASFNENLDDTLEYPTKWLATLLTCFLKGGARWLVADSIRTFSDAAGHDAGGSIRLTIEGDLRSSAHDELLYASSDPNEADGLVQLLGSYLLAHEAGGSISCSTSGNRAKFDFQLPTIATTVPEQPDETALTYEMFRSLEYWD